MALPLDALDAPDQTNEDGVWIGPQAAPDGVAAALRGSGLERVELGLISHGAAFVFQRALLKFKRHEDLIGHVISASEPESARRRERAAQTQAGIYG